MSKQSGADWLAWGLHFIYGLIIGALVGVLVCFNSETGSWLGDDTELIQHFIWGFALFGGGFGSRYGDKLWMSANRQHVLKPDDPKQSALSELASATAAGIGVLLVAIVLCKRFRLLD